MKLPMFPIDIARARASHFATVPEFWSERRKRWAGKVPARKQRESLRNLAEYADSRRTEAYRAMVRCANGCPS